MQDKRNPPSNVVPLRASPAKTLTPAAVASSTRWLTAWTPAEPVPTDARDQLPLLLASAEEAIAPADVQGFAVAMDSLVQWLERFGVIAFFDDFDQRKAQIADIVRGYREALSDLPADVLLRAVADTTRTHRYRNLPLPADVRAHAEAELRERQNRLLRLKTAAQIADRAEQRRAMPPTDTPEVSAEKAAAVRDMLAAAGVAPKAFDPPPVAVADGPIKRVVADRGDLRQPVDDSPRAALARAQAALAGFRKIDRSKYVAVANGAQP